MLVLTLSTNQGPIHVIDEESGSMSEVHLLEVVGNHQIRIGFECPRTVTVLRDKVLKEKGNEY